MSSLTVNLINASLDNEYKTKRYVIIALVHGSDKTYHIGNIITHTDEEALLEFKRVYSLLNIQYEFCPSDHINPMMGTNARTTYQEIVKYGWLISDVLYAIQFKSNIDHITLNYVLLLKHDTPSVSIASRVPPVPT